jgi:hypothetical protein
MTPTLSLSQHCPHRSSIVGLEAGGQYRFVKEFGVFSQVLFAGGIRGGAGLEVQGWLEAGNEHRMDARRKVTGGAPKRVNGLVLLPLLRLGFSDAPIERRCLPQVQKNKQDRNWPVCQ